MLEAGHVAHLGGKGYGDDQIDAAQGLQAAHDRSKRLRRDKLGDGRLDAGDALLRDAHGLDHLLKRDLMSGMLEALLPKPVKSSSQPTSWTWPVGTAATGTGASPLSCDGRDGQ
jgi:hypothetical protein